MQEREETIDVYIRPHLISFLYQELAGSNEAAYEHRKIKLIRVTKESVLGRMIYVYAKLSGNTNLEAVSNYRGYHLFISVDVKNPENSSASLLQHFNRRTNESLKLLPEYVKIINDYLESLFRICLIEYVKGYCKKNSIQDESFVSEAIHQFMLSHRLYDTETDPEALRRLYYRSVKKNHCLERIQFPISNQIKSYAVA